MSATLEVCRSNSAFSPDAKYTDLLLRTGANTQRVLVLPGSNIAAPMIVSYSNVAIFGSLTVNGSNVTPGTGTDVATSNYAYGALTTQAGWASNAGAFGSNTSVAASIVTFNTSNYAYGPLTSKADYNSNTSVSASNKAFSIVDGAYGSNLAVVTSNYAWGPNTISVLFGSNTAVAASNQAYSIVDGAFGSNTSVWTSNSYVVNSNANWAKLIATSNQAYTPAGGAGVGWATYSSNLYSMCNGVGIGLSNPTSQLSVNGAVSAQAICLDITGNLAYGQADSTAVWSSNAVVSLSNVVANKNALLTSVQSTSAAAAVSTSTQIDVDATNLAVTFTAPASGKVIVKLTGSCYMQPGANSSCTGVWNLRSGGSDVANTKRTAAYLSVGSGGGQSSTTVQYSTLVTGLTSGASYTWKWGHGNPANNSSYTLSISSTDPATMEVWSA